MAIMVAPSRRKTWSERETARPERRAWWAGLDSNQRSETQRVYSPSPLATRVPTPGSNLANRLRRRGAADAELRRGLRGRQQEITNAVDQASRELATRFDFKGTDSVMELKDDAIEIESASEERLKAVTQVLEEKLVKRKVSLKVARLRQGRRGDQGPRPPEGRRCSRASTRRRPRRSASTSRSSGSRVCSTKCRAISSASIGKKRDDLQTAIAKLKEHDFGIPLQFNNFRD